MACTTVYRITGDATAADVADALAKPIRIVFILLVAWIVVLDRRGPSSTASSGTSAVASSGSRDLRPGVSVLDTVPHHPRARRAPARQTIGAVLRSVVVDR